MPRFRFTIRRMMIAVAIVGILFGAFAMKRRRDYFLRRSIHYERLEGYSKLLSAANADRARIERSVAKMKREVDSISRPKSSPSPSSRPDDEYVFVPPEPASEKLGPDEFERDAVHAEHEAAAYREKGAWYERMKLKYGHAARHPWLPFAPDPPRPE